MTRQTVYAHFAAREVLVAAVVDRLKRDVAAAMDAAALDDGPAPAALERLLTVGWSLLPYHPLLRQAVPDEEAGPGTGAGTGSGTEAAAAARCRHGSADERLVGLVRRGQQEGDFDTGIDPAWAAAAIFALCQAAATEATTGRLPLPEAAPALLAAALRILGAHEA